MRTRSTLLRSFGRFRNGRSPALGIPMSPLCTEWDAAAKSMSLVPAVTYYTALAEERKNILRTAYEAEKPADPRKSGRSFAYLNLARILAPQRSIQMTLQAIQTDPANMALHNLLGLDYLENGNLPSAKVVWLSLMARGVKNSAVLTNLGVVALLEGNEPAAIAYFQEAAGMEAPRQALANLGFIALKYRNGFEAKKEFEKTLAIQK